MKKVLNCNFEAGSRKQTNEPRRMSEVLDEFFKSDEPLARAYRDHIFNNMYPHTEPCCQLKLLTREPRRMPVGTYLNGIITHDKENHFTFCETASERKGRKNSRCVFKGYTINVHRKDEGTLFPTFRKPRYTRSYTFQSYCREAAEELLMVVGLLEE